MVSTVAIFCHESGHQALKYHFIPSRKDKNENLME
jgi:hypothetical protein